MAWRKWLVRSLVFTVAGSLAAGVLLVQRFTNPAAVRRQVVSRLTQHFPGAVISLDSADMRLLGGIAFRDLRLSRRDDSGAAVFAQVPSGIIYHDKEALLHGRLAIRKIQLNRLHLRVEHRRDGTWNLVGILGPVHPEEPIPTIIIQQATIVFEDYSQSTAVPPVTVHDVDLTILNDPLPTLVLAGAGQSELTGPVQVYGSWQRISEEFAAALQATGVPIGKPFLQHLASYHPDLIAQVGQLEGAGKIEAEFSYHRGNSPAWSHDIRWQLGQGKLNHPRLPEPLDHLELKLRCQAGRVTLEQCTARAGAATLEFTGKASAPDANADLEGHLRVDNLAVNARLFACLPQKLQDVEHEFSPKGAAHLSFAFRRRAGQWTRRCVVQPQNMSGLCDKFRFPVERVTGMIDYEFDPPRSMDVTRVDLTCYAGPRPVRVKGKIEGERPAGVWMDISGEDIPIDDRLLAALPPEQQKLARSFEPRGRLDFAAHLRRGQGGLKFANRFVIRIHHGAARYAVFPYPLEEVSGVLDIQPGHWEFREFRGSHKGAEVRTAGRSIPSPQGDRIFIEISGSNLVLDSELEAALKPSMKRAWQVLSPGGRINFAARVDRLPGTTEPDLDVTVRPVGGTLQPAFFPYALENITGLVRYGRGKVELENLEGRHGPSVFRVGKGEVLVEAGGGVYVNLDDLEGNPVVPDLAFFQALPPAIEKACVALQLRHPFALRTQLTIHVPPDPAAPPIIFWDGGAALSDAALHAGVQLDHVTGTVYCRGRHHGKLEGVAGNVQLEGLEVFRQPLRNVHTQVLVTRDEPEVLLLRGINAQVFGGVLGGEARVECSPALRYELDLHAAQVQLDQFARRNLAPGADMNGLAAARLYVQGQGTDLGGLQGRGSIDVPNGKMYNLPFLLDLLKILNLRSPDRTAFEEAHARFSIRGQRVNVSRLDLYGNAVSLGGRGEMNLDGSDINLDFHAVLARLPQVLPPVLKEIPPAISKNLLKITARGRLGDVRFRREPVPVLVDPLRELLEHLAGRGK